ncbi:glycosyl hydrolase [Pelagicoccus mobilis]|uniref:glucan endo-1,3-beta-D-glucosidase n=1 Tax=Pelagicoccus mobilis TaxID=415221 RepID=A0A934VSZ3_9BACT|nr:glycosyl hydrolase [Pelagicoccus mobilis]MBK1879158.1 Ig-like domain-containing protein [Pelagicoccus mobilis]
MKRSSMNTFTWLKELTLLSFFLIIAALTSAQTIVPIGSGSYTTEFPGVDEAGRNGFPDGTPYLSGPAASKPVPTNDWWSNLLKQSHGGQAFNYPLSYRSLPQGLVVNYTMPAGGTPTEYRQPMSDVAGITVGVVDLSAPSSTASDHSDWTATINWNDGVHDFSALMGHGMPFTYFTKGDADLARIKIGFNEAGVSISENKLLIENNFGGASYIVYGPAGSTWSASGNEYTSDLNGQNYWSMVMVPASMTMASAAPYFEAYAYSFPTDTRIEWTYDETTSTVRTDFIITPTVMEGPGNTVFWGILPHHWANLAPSSTTPGPYTYETVRGEMRTLTSNTFSTEIRFSGILPTMPDVAKYSGSFDPSEIAQVIEQMKADTLATWTDSYNEGQVMNRLVQTARIADQLGNIEARDQMLATVKERLEDWLTAESGEVAFLFYYNDDWDALIGYPAGHRQDTNINDHHFHWGYFIHAAAVLEQYYPGWAADWGDMINMLIRDAANPSRTDSMFPFLRNYSPYAGHSWANGFATEPFGNDQESTSESMQFNSSLIHWGAVTGNDEIRDLGIFLYTSEHSSVNEYWFDQNDRTFQPSYAYEMVARVWGGGYDNGTWWTTDVAASYGIQLYPIHGGSLYLGHNTDYVQEAWQGMAANTEVLSNIPNGNLWYDTYWKFLSFLDPAEALNLYNNYRERDLKFGVSDAQTYHWLHAMVALGQVAEEITPDYPIAAAFNNGGEITYAAHNYTAVPITVNFSDGFSLDVPAFSRATNRDLDLTVNLTVSETEIPSGATVDLAVTVSSPVDRVDFFEDGVLVGSDDTAPYEMSTAGLLPGHPGFFAKAYIGEAFNISNVESVQVGSQVPLSGVAFPIPGEIQAGNYDEFEGGRGQGIAYSDTTVYNEGGYRPSEGVDAASDPNEGAIVGWIESGEWLEFTVDVAATGNYDATIRYANGSGGTGGPLVFDLDGTPVGPEIPIPTTSGWGSWETLTVEDIPLTAGQHILQAQAIGSGFNLGRITFSNADGPAIALSSITVSPDPVTLQDGQSQQFSATGLDQNGNPMFLSPNWGTSGGAINSSGLYNANSTGDFTVTASFGSLSGSADVSVTRATSVLTSMSVSPLAPAIDIGATLLFTASGLDQYGDTMVITPTWTANGGTIDETGLYTGNANGIFEITATSGSVSSSTTIAVGDVTPVLTTIQVSPDSAELNIGDSQQFTAEAFDQFGSPFPTTIVWDGTDATGLFNAIALGSFTVTASSGALSDTANVSVVEKDLNGCSGEEDDYSWSISSTEIVFTSKTGSAWVDAHLTINGGNEQNVRMATTGDGVHTQAITTAPGDIVDVFFTYAFGEGAKDSLHHACTVGGGSGEDPTEPSEAASAPTLPEDCVVALYSDAYTTIDGVNFNPFWGQATVVTHEEIAGDNALKYSGLNYQGTDFAGNPQDVSGMDSLHLDFWTADSTALNLYLISPGPVETPYTLPVTPGQWVSVDIPLTDFVPVDLTNVFQLKFDGNGTVFLDNIYFSKTPEEAGCSGEEDDYSWSISETEIVFTSKIGSAWVDAHYTINGGAQQNIRMLAAGDGVHTQAITTAPSDIVDVFFTYAFGEGAKDSPHHACTVGGGSGEDPTEPSEAAPAPTLPEDCVVALYSDAYTAIDGVNFNPFWGQATVVTHEEIAGDNALKYSGLNYQGTDFAGNPQDVSGMDSLHLDFWTADSTVLNLYLISPGPVETPYALPITPGQWVSVDIPLTDFAPVDLTSVFQLKFDGNGTVFLDNIYFSKEPVLTGCTGDEADYTWYITDTEIVFDSNIGSEWVDVHYKINGGPQQNLRMSNIGDGIHITPITKSEGDVVEVFFTYALEIGAKDSSTHYCPEPAENICSGEEEEYGWSISERELVFTSYLGSEWVDAHYTVNGGTQQNARMSDKGDGVHVLQIDATAGDLIDVFFTYAIEIGAKDSPHHSCAADETPLVLESIIVSPDTVSIDLGQSQQFTAQGFDQFGDPMAITPVWTEADENGLFSATEVGSFVVTASLGDVFAQATITVNDPVCDAPKWNRRTAYDLGDIVTFRGHAWKWEGKHKRDRFRKWWHKSKRARGFRPGIRSGWTNLGPCL